MPEVPRVVVPNARAETPAELLQAILFDLNLPYQGLSEQELRLAATGHLLDATATADYPTVLVLDEAQLLDTRAIEELRLLSNLECRTGAAIFTLLVGQSSLRERMSESFAHRVGAMTSLSPLTHAESGDYLRHQLSAAGGDADALLDAEAIEVLASACIGIPRLLNRAAARALELAAAAEATLVDVEAAMEALERLGLACEDAEADEPRLLPHPARTAKPTATSRAKSSTAAGEDEVAGRRGPKEKTRRKRAA